MVRCLNWLVTLGQYDVHYTTRQWLWSAMVAMTLREGHMRAMARVFGYINSYAKMSITYDTDILDFSGLTFRSYEWEQIWWRNCPMTCLLLKENQWEWAAPSTPIVQDVCGQGGLQQGLLCSWTRHQSSGWYSKQQNTVETLTYGLELVAARSATEFTIELWYKVGMLGVPMLGQCMLFGDNKSLVTNVSMRSLMLKKKHIMIAYHQVHEAVAVRVIDMVHCSTKVN